MEPLQPSEETFGRPPLIKCDRTLILPSLVVTLVAVVYYWLTAYRTIAWWDSGEYSLAAICLGIPHPPGSQLAVSLGWLATRLPLGLSDIVVLNGLAGILAAVTAGLTCGIGIWMFRRCNTNSAPNLPTILLGFVAILATLLFSLGDTLWNLATRFTPYTLTPLLTALIIGCLLRWWYEADQPSSLRWLLAAALVLGLDFSVHRTNLLLIPGVLVWILLRDRRTLARLRSWIGGGVAFFLGLAFHLITIPLSARSPVMNMCDPSNWSRFWDYIMLKQYGGGMLINLFPRKAPFFSVQMVDYFKIFGDNFAHFEGSILLGILPLLLGLTGLWFLWRDDRRLAIGTIVLFLCASIVGVFYFNTQANFFRSMDRHYLPSLLVFTVWIIYGSCALVTRAVHLRSRGRFLIAAAIGALILASASHHVARNYARVDASKNCFAIDFARNILKCLPQDAILFTGGDNDTYPLWFAQKAEGLRPDVDILNIGLMNTSWYLKQLRPSVPLTLTADEIDELRPIHWSDSVVSIPVAGKPEDFSLPSSTVLPDSINLRVGPSFENVLLINDQLLLKMLLENRWKRPICLAVTLDMNAFAELQPYARFDGMFHRVVPLEGAPGNPALIEDCVVRNCEYRGYNDPDVPLDQTARMMGMNYCAAFLTLMTAQAEAGDSIGCARTYSALQKLLPDDRLDWPAFIRQRAGQMCVHGADQSQP
jgi:hypothetical protein